MPKAKPIPVKKIHPKNLPEPAPKSQPKSDPYLDKMLEDRERPACGPVAVRQLANAISSKSTAKPPEDFVSKDNLATIRLTCKTLRNDHGITLRQIQAAVYFLVYGSKP